MGNQHLQHLSHRHELIMNFMLLYPDEKLGIVAQFFGVSGPWLSTVIHSDIFQARLAERKDEMFAGTVLNVRERMEGIVAYGLERCGEILENSEDDKLVADITDKTLQRLGYGTRGGTPSPVVQQNNLQVNNFGTADERTITEARELMGRVLQQNETPALPAPSPGDELAEVGS